MKMRRYKFLAYSMFLAAGLSAAPQVLHAQTYTGSDGSGMDGSSTDGTSDQNQGQDFVSMSPKDVASIVQAEANSQLASATAQAAAALSALDTGPVTPVVPNTPPGVTIAAPAAPVRQSLPPIDLSKLPPELSRPVTINWNGPVDGAVQKIANMIGYKFLPSPTAPATPPNMLLDEKAKASALVFQEIGARISTYAYLNLNPNTRTVQIIYKAANK